MTSSEKKGFQCREGHWGKDDEAVYNVAIDCFVELSAAEWSQLKRIFKGEDIDIRDLSAKHDPQPDADLRQAWQRLGKKGWK